MGAPPAETSITLARGVNPSGQAMTTPPKRSLRPKSTRHHGCGSCAAARQPAPPAATAAAAACPATWPEAASCQVAGLSNSAASNGGEGMK
jgi:hypothetical protein